MFEAILNMVLPIITACVYFFMAFQIYQYSKVRMLIVGEMAYKKVFLAFIMFGIYFLSRPFQMLWPHPWPMIINSVRQSFLMAIIAPSILVGIFHWVPDEKGPPASADFASYGTGLCAAIIFVLANKLAITDSKIIVTLGNYHIYDAVWFPEGHKYIEIVLIHLISQLISPVGFFMLAAAYVRHRRYNSKYSEVYVNLPLKWKYLEVGLLIFVVSLCFSGLAAFFGKYYTYLWVIYFTAAIVAGIIEVKGVKIPPGRTSTDLL
ncbi:MAG: hypothetical protein LHV68_06905 [Elusimicrobia bacterium]|nr:hypothetical protein [Candidatus Liberimonas magnetica]